METVIYDEILNFKPCQATKQDCQYLKPMLTDN